MENNNFTRDLNKPITAAELKEFHKSGANKSSAESRKRVQDLLGTSKHSKEPVTKYSFGPGYQLNDKIEK